jgi:hypothetical protein
VSAANYNIDAGKNNTEIQGIINNAQNGDTINFTENGIYEDINLNIDKSLKFIGNNATLKTNGENNLITLSNADGSSFTGFNFYSSNSKTENLLYVDGNASNYVIKNNYFYGGDTHLSLFNAINCSIDNNKFENSAYRAIMLGRDKSNTYSAGTFGNVTISNNYFNNHYDVIEIRVENVSITNNLIENFGAYNGIDPTNPMVVSMSNGGLGLYLRMEWTSGIVYNNTIRNGDIAIKHTNQRDGCYDVYGNTFENLLGDEKSKGVIAYGVNVANSYYDNVFKNLPVAIALSSESNKINIGPNTYTDVGKAIYLPGNGVDPSLKSAKLNITTQISNNSVKKGEVITYIIKISNIGDLDAKNIIINLNGINKNFAIDYLFASIGEFDKEGNYWQIDSLSGNKDATLTLNLKSIADGNNKFNATGSYNSGTDPKNLNSESENIDVNVVKEDTQKPVAPAKANIKITQSKDKISGKTLVRTYTFKNIGGKTGTKAFTYTISKNLLKKVKSYKVTFKSAGVSYSLKNGKLTLKVTNLAKNASKKITFTAKLK